MAHVSPGDDNEIKQSIQLLEQITSHHQTFLRFQEEAKIAGDSLSREGESTPALCSRHVKPLFQFDDHIVTFHVLLQQIHLPDHINQRRHDIQIAFQKIEPSVDSLKRCLQAFANGNLQWEETRAQRAAILYATRTLEQHLSDFNELLADILKIPSTQKGSNNDKNGDSSSESTEEEHKQRTEPVPIDSVSLSEKQSSPLFMSLYELLKMYTDDLALREICRIVGTTYNLLNGDSHAAKAFSLTEQLDNENRLSELEEELRRRLPGRFQEPPSDQ
ncbi:MAG TPA: hypothetical protein VKY19_29745 [Ktedonosporobacter sp.]|jgi:hypothetical protein|nr:hypothetical protein [Ktedonosporobacter sp.]